MSYRLLSVDPGPVKSGAVVSSVVAARDLRERGKWEHPFGVQPERALWIPNDEILEMALDLANFDGSVNVIAAERIAAAYKGAGLDLFDSQLVAGALVDGIARMPEFRGIYVFKATAEACLGLFVYGGVRGDSEVKNALLAMYGGETRAVGGLVCKTCRRDDGLRGRKKEPCLNCNADAGGHGALGLENPLGPLAILGNNQHLFDALAVGVTAAMIIGSTPPSA